MKRNSLFSIFTVCLTLLLTVWFFVALAGVSNGQSLDGRQQLEDALRRAAVTCYAAEGIYPPTLAYLQTQYGIQIDETRYRVFYEPYGENMLPEITVLEKQ